MEKLLTVKQAAKILRIRPDLLRKLAVEHKIGFVQLTKRRRAFTEAQVQAFIERCSKGPKHKIDTTTAQLVRSKPKKGGDKPKSSGREEDPSTIRKELKALCQ